MKQLVTLKVTGHIVVTVLDDAHLQEKIDTLYDKIYKLLDQCDVTIDDRKPYVADF